MTAFHSHDIIVTYIWEHLSTLSGSDSKDLAKPEHYITIQCSGFYFYSRMHWNNKTKKIPCSGDWQKREI